MSWLSRLRRDKQQEAPSAKPAAAAPGEIPPPWVQYPGVPPGDFFWREAGEAWFKDVWEPFYNALPEPEQTAYLQRWSVPNDWSESYFDEATRDFWEHVDDEE